MRRVFEYYVNRRGFSRINWVVFQILYNTLLSFKALMISENAKLFINQDVGEPPNKVLIN